MKNSIKGFLFHCEIEKRLSVKTIKAYKTDLNQFLVFQKDSDIESIEEIQKEELKAYILKISKLAPRTIKRKVATLKVFFNFHEFEETIFQNPFRKVKINLRMPMQLPSVMTLSEVEKILKTVKQSVTDVTDKSSFGYKEKIRNIAVLELLFATGLRVSELSSLKYDNILKDFSAIKVLGKGSKERNIPITNFYIKDALKKYHKVFKSEIEQSSFFLSTV